MVIILIRVYILVESKVWMVITAPELRNHRTHMGHMGCSQRIVEARLNVVTAYLVLEMLQLAQFFNFCLHTIY